MKAAEAGNNGCVGGSLVPTLTLGIPGNSVAAALMGAFIIQGMIPGPDLFTQYADKTYPFILSMFIANGVFLIVGLTVAPYLARIALIPPAIMVPVVSTFAVLGSYALNNAIFDVYMMIAFAGLGLVLKKLGYSLEALILGLILGPIAEGGFSQGMIMGKGSPWIFFESSIAKVMWVFIILLLVPPLYSYWKNVAMVKAPPADEMDGLEDLNEPE